MAEVGIYDVMRAGGTAAQIPGACPYCSGPFSSVHHAGLCPRVRAIEYHPNGSIKRVEFHRPSPPTGEKRGSESGPVQGDGC